MKLAATGQLRSLVRRRPSEAGVQWVSACFRLVLGISYMDLHGKSGNAFSFVKAGPSHFPNL